MVGKVRGGRTLPTRFITFPIFTKKSRKSRARIKNRVMAFCETEMEK